MPDFKVNFKELKAHVGVTDVAYALGYRLDRKAGVGRYIELVLGDGREKRDTIIVSHPNDRAAQTFSAATAPRGMYLRLSVRIWIPSSSPARTIGRRRPRSWHASPICPNRNTMRIGNT